MFLSLLGGDAQHGSWNLFSVSVLNGYCVFNSLFIIFSFDILSPVDPVIPQYRLWALV